MKTVVVVPAFNEGGRVGDVVRNLAPYADAVFVVDDGSRDQTADEAEAAGAVVLRHSINRGQGAALKTGVDAALLDGAELIVHYDADGQHVPSHIPELIAPLREGRADVMYGSRYMGIKSEGMPLVRQMLHRGIRLFNIVMLGIPRNVTDPQSGLRAMTAAAARKISFSQDRMAHCSEILRLVTRPESGLRWSEIPVLVRYSADTLRKGNQTRDAFKIVWQLFVGSKK